MATAMMTTEIKSFAERQRALQEHARVARQHAEAEIRALERKKGEVAARVESELALAEQNEAACSEGLADAIASELARAIAPHVQAWIDEPSRKVASALAEVFKRYSERALHELGVETWNELIAAAFAIELVKSYPAASNTFGQPWSSHVVELCGTFRRALDAGPASIEFALAALESHMQTVAATATGEPSVGNVKRLALKAGCATHAIAGRRQSDFDREVEQRRLEAFARDYVPPETLRERAMRMIGL